MAESSTPRHHVVVIGGGFAGLYCAQGLGRSPVDVTLVDRRNFHLFQPLLYQVATGSLSPANIAAPLRTILKRQANVRVWLGEVSDFDTVKKEVALADGSRLPYDTLVVACGSHHHYFGHDAEWEPIAPGLKTIEDATEIRRNILLAFEAAERETDPDKRKRLLTFVIVGGGPTGVELAGAIGELARTTMTREFRAFNPADCRVVVVEGQPRVLTNFHEKLSAKALQALTALGVEVQCDAHVTAVTPTHVEITSDVDKSVRRIETSTVVWAAGVKANPLGRKLVERLGAKADVDRGGRVSVAPDCTVPGFADYFIIGDMMSQKDAAGKPLPGVAPVAMQQGDYVADVIDRRVRGKSPRAAFHYWDKGSMATIGRARAVVETGRIRLSGLIAWLAWLFIHVLYLARFENRLLVVFQWFFAYVTNNRAARIITWMRTEEQPDQKA
ncbi:NAD(P)/FAD-dependent oxidoreductase [Limnoglobus roseus]|uniref:NADH:ubiquinone reductase (non-electrogenic) n=1 Tax=Limnoglobus roseus TaxID=2598579 RepID=A0A5C1A300_9BACT|nr:NAD(P)/FAD-dependent oxidoreductase [Limnoglobus roseus]QEL13489.1 NAD(P)/FAD-dependent oxidoreductase [Limnoglobus roseus]